MQSFGAPRSPVPLTPPAPVGPVTTETIEYLLQSYEEEGVPEEELQELRALLAGLKNGTMSIPEPRCSFDEVPSELKKGSDGYEFVYSTAAIADPFADFRDIELVSVEPVAESSLNDEEESLNAKQNVRASAAQRRLEGEHRVLEAEWHERNSGDRI